MARLLFEDIPVFGVCRPACHDSSLYLFVLVLFLEAVVLSQVHVAWDIFYLHIVHVYRGVNLLNMPSDVAVNSLGEMVYPSLTPLLILIYSLSLCRSTVTELTVYISFRISMYTSSILCSCNDVNIAWVCTESNAFS